MVLISYRSGTVLHLLLDYSDLHWLLGLICLQLVQALRVDLAKSDLRGPRLLMVVFLIRQVQLIFRLALRLLMVVLILRRRMMILSLRRSLIILLVPWLRIILPRWRVLVSSMDWLLMRPDMLM